MLNKRADKTTLLWIPDNHGIAGTEDADACAKQAAEIPDGVFVYFVFFSFKQLGAKVPKQT